MSGRCWRWNHTWEEWQSVASVTKKRFGTAIKHGIVQIRHCRACGKVQMQRVWIK